MIFDTICSMESHFSVENILQYLSDHRPSIARATIYRSVILFEKIGLIRQSRISGAGASYELILGRRHHEHMICTLCGKVIEFESKGIEAIQESICQAHDFTMTHHYLHIFGLCADCQNTSAIKRRAKSTRAKQASR